jgi:hypothetical protein
LLRIRFQYPTGATLGVSIERLSDGLLFDNSDTTFKANPTSPIAALPEDTGIFRGRFKINLNSTQFASGDYAVTIHDQSLGTVAAQIAAVINNGDDATVIPLTPVIPDPWSTALPGLYPDGSAGAIIGQKLDVKVSTRSTFSGGTVAGVTAPVTVGTSLDKTGYSLSSNGLDSVSIEPGVNLRQAVSPILAASAGVLSGAGTGSIVIKGANVSTTRILASTDNAGNRTSVTLTLPT